MWMRLGVILVGSFLIGFLLELPAGLLALGILIFVWAIIFIPMQLDNSRHLKSVKDDAYRLLTSTSPNPARIELAIKVLSRFPKDKETKELVKQLTEKLQYDPAS
jgi:hypothetical protein